MLDKINQLTYSKIIFLKLLEAGIGDVHLAVYSAKSNNQFEQVRRYLSKMVHIHRITPLEDFFFQEYSISRFCS